MQILVYFLIVPAVCVCLYRLLRGKSAQHGPAAAEWLLTGLPCFLVMYAVCLPLDRLGVYFNDVGDPSLRFGKTALLFYGALCAGFTLLRLWRKADLNALRGEARKSGAAVKALRVLAHGCAGMLLLLTSAYLWARSSYDNISLDEIVFYLNMPLQGTARSFTEDLLLRAVLPALIAFLALEILCVFIRSKAPVRYRFKGVPLLYAGHFPARMSLVLVFGVLFFWLSVLYPCGDFFLKIESFVKSQINSSPLIEQEYADAGSLALQFPQEKRNLITLYIESCESTSQDVANGGVFEKNYIPELTQLARDNVSFSQSTLIQGAAVPPASGWTMGGLVAQSAGVPLKFFKYTPDVDNMGEQFVDFLPGAVTLGDVLKDAGYRNVFMAGSDFTFGGRRLYYTQHGDYEVRDYLAAVEAGVIPADSYIGWGMQDVNLYQYAKDTLAELAAGEEPFHLAILTVDTHNPCFECELCPQEEPDHFGKVIACSSLQAAEFVRWCQQQDFYENTSIVITGDHASMVDLFYKDSGLNAGKHSGSAERFVYNAFINSAVQPVQEQNRKFTTLDFYPSVLASIGVTIPGERLGLGVNLFSGEPTLCETYGYDYLFAELNKKSPFYNETLLYP